MEELDRYSRQVIFPGIGAEGQKKLGEGLVLLVGCGALGTVIASEGPMPRRSTCPTLVSYSADLPNSPRTRPTCTWPTAAPPRVF